MDAPRYQYEDIPLVGVVATNQIRKQWDLIASICTIVAEHRKSQVRFWWHIDIDSRHWSIPALISDFGLDGLVEVTYPPVDDAWLASKYTDCAVTLMPSPEGFGYPAFESLACGTPCVAGDWAALGSLYNTCGLTDLLVKPYGERAEGIHNSVRPVYDPRDFAEKVLAIIDNPWDVSEVSSHVEHLGWDKLGHRFKRWFKEGI